MLDGGHAAALYGASSLFAAHDSDRQRQQEHGSTQVMTQPHIHTLAHVSFEHHNRGI